jgi:hypothetical protein
MNMKLDTKENSRNKLRMNINEQQNNGQYNFVYYLHSRIKPYVFNTCLCTQPLERHVQIKLNKFPS